MILATNSALSWALFRVLEILRFHVFDLSHATSTETCVVGQEPMISLRHLEYQSCAPNSVWLLEQEK